MIHADVDAAANAADLLAEFGLCPRLGVTERSGAERDT